jgi:hypothetical protein
MTYQAVPDSYKYPGGQCMQNGRETLKKLFRVHFPDYKLTDDSGVVRVSRIWVYAKA